MHGGRPAMCASISRQALCTPAWFRSRASTRLFPRESPNGLAAIWFSHILADIQNLRGYAVIVAADVLNRLERLRGNVIPSDVEMTVTRNYGDAAKEKSNELLYHMLIAVISGSVLIAITLGFRESLIVFIAIPVTLALTLTVFYLYGYTPNRITLFALIFPIGILVDDAIVVVENIVGHWRMPENQVRPPFEVAIKAVDEVGNPTILAKLAVVAAILPMAFVGGLMGPICGPFRLAPVRRCCFLYRSHSS
jgi:multidrug efflux pump subunit AcrB